MASVQSPYRIVRAHAQLNVTNKLDPVTLKNNYVATLRQSSEIPKIELRKIRSYVALQYVKREGLFSQAKCIAGFSQNCVQNHEGVFRKSYKCIAGFSQNCVQASLNSVTGEDRIKLTFAVAACGVWCPY